VVLPCADICLTAGQNRLNTSGVPSTHHRQLNMQPLPNAKAVVECRLKSLRHFRSEQCSRFRVVGLCRPCAVFRVEGVVRTHFVCDGSAPLAKQGRGGGVACDKVTSTSVRQGWKGRCNVGKVRASNVWWQDDGAITDMKHLTSKIHGAKGVTQGRMRRDVRRSRASTANGTGFVGFQVQRFPATDPS
jgi:hypothetical protein